MISSDESACPAQLGDVTGARMSEIRSILRPPPTGEWRTNADGEPRLVNIVQESQPLSGEVHTGNTTRLVIVLAGRLVVTVGGDTLTVSSGEAVLIPPGQEFREHSNECGGLQEIVITLSGGPPMNLGRLSDGAGRLREIARWLLVERQAGFEAADQYRNDLARVLLNECRRLELDGAGALEKGVRAYVLEHIGEAITLDALARYVGMGKFHLCRKYRSATGLSPMHAVRAIRMEQARDLIQCTRLPLRAVARRVGLRSEQHLSRLLKAYFGAGVKDLRTGSIPPKAGLSHSPAADPSAPPAEAHASFSAAAS